MLEFDPQKHEYKLDDVVLPHTTRVLANVGITDLSMVQQEILEWRAVFGTSGHEVCRKWDQGTLDITHLNPAMLPILEGYIQLKEDFGLEILEIEYRNYHPVWKYGFTLDRIARITKGKYKNKLVVVDLKTGSYLDGVAIQLGSYKLGWNSIATKPMKASLAMCVQLGRHKTGRKYRHWFYNDVLYEQIFISALQIYRYKQSKKSK